ncbi:MAG: hypothetical protein WD766_09870 [Gemmatimonadota bacterium]
MTPRVRQAMSENPRSGGSSLGAMYVMAAFLMLVGSLFVVAMMFVPSDWLDGSDTSDAYIPGSGPGFVPAARPAVLQEPPGVTQMGPDRYRVVIEAYNWEYVPKEIRVPLGAEVQFVARSAQDYHGIAIIGTGIIMPLLQNEIAEATHTFTEPGEYIFVCADYCGAGHATMSGTVIVE